MTDNKTDNQQVLFKTVSCQNGSEIAIATLNDPTSLNALNLSMVKCLFEKLSNWQQDDNIAVVIIDGAGDKSFCAGGDVVSLYHDLVAKQESGVSEVDENIAISDKNIAKSLAAEFFTQEYQLNLLIHQFTKPLLVWGNGYVIGGGMGLFAGASHRIVTERTLIAMPEITIGLYPDVGASYFLNNIPEPFGLFIGLTGTMINSADALYLELSNGFICQNEKHAFIEQLCLQPWQNNQHDYVRLTEIVSQFSGSSITALPISDIKEHQSAINQLMSGKNINEIDLVFESAVFTSKFLTTAQKKYQQGSALSAAIIFQQLKNCKNAALATSLTKELHLSLRCCQFTEFTEGVRALLVDKDKHPKWAYRSVVDVPPHLLSWFFSELNSITTSYDA
ncbi:enoyl-CoA hydratase/isomerase family protein [Thalassotalea sp. PLHSN55]|uniref:enoyl-CoA hydratase/isomerase family protein n=1 Tax=Thalassotalea sp. PLHSN55 TaxID=3435888 RepID=UPI003F833B4F